MDLMEKTRKTKKKCSIKMALYAFDDKKIIDELKDMPKRVSIKFLVDQSNDKDLSKKLEKIGSLNIIGKHKVEKLHEKFAIFDCEDAEEGFPVVFSGSYNWTKSAAEINYDNCLLISGNNTPDKEIIKKFKDRFKELKNESYKN